MKSRPTLALLAASMLAACAAVPGGPAPAAVVPAVTVPAAPSPAQLSAALAVPAEAFGAGQVVEQFGVRLTGVHLTANGYVIDLRYRVLDPAKAQPLLDRTLRPVLIDEATGSRFYVPVPPTVGALRQTSRNKVIHTDRDYFMLFANPDRKLQAGSKVTLYVGDQRFGNLQISATGTPTAASQLSGRNGGQVR